MTFITYNRTNIQEQEEKKPETILETRDEDEIDLVLPFRNTETQARIFLIDEEYEEEELELPFRTVETQPEILIDEEMAFRNTETDSGNPETDSEKPEIDPEEFKDDDDISLETAEWCKRIIAERYWTIKRRIAETQLEKLQNPEYTEVYTERITYFEGKEFLLKSELDFWENRVIEIIRNGYTEEEKQEAVQTANILRRYVDETDANEMDEEMSEYCRD